jgi:hypothetical protein
MHRNHAVYKGYRLTARVTRPAAPIPATGAPMFSAGDRAARLGSGR